jgi:hypothetical protein
MQENSYNKIAIIEEDKKKIFELNAKSFSG